MSDLEFDRHTGYISDALEYAGGTHTVEDMRNLVADTRLQFWPGKHSVVLTQIIDTPRKRVLHIVLAGGDAGAALHELRDLLPRIEAFAWDHDCDMVVAYGRPAWGRAVFNSAGYDSPTMEFRKCRDQ